jgi:hypothetical protein
MPNWEIAEARRYHKRTKHSVESVHRSAHYLDWKNWPSPFKEYPGVEPLPLPEELPKPKVPVLEALAGAPEPPTTRPGLPDLARLLGGTKPWRQLASSTTGVRGPLQRACR